MTANAPRPYNRNAMSSGDAQVTSSPDEERDVETGSAPNGENSEEPVVLYGVDEIPPWDVFILLTFQQYFMTIINFSVAPLIVAGPVCLLADVVGTSQYLSTALFVMGVSSLIQTFFGIRLPMMQGMSATFFTPIFILMRANRNKCPNFEAAVTSNVTFPFEAGSEAHQEIWMSNLRELQGALIVGSLFEMFLGLSGLIGVIMKFISPITTASILTSIGLSLFDTITRTGSTHWWLCITCIFFIILFSQCFRQITVPFFRGTRIQIFLLFPFLFGLSITWLICYILTETGALPDKKGEWGYRARTDIKTDALSQAEWIQIPRPVQWGTPTFNVQGALSMLAAFVASSIESVGDYHAAARISNIPPPPSSAVNRGIATEGLGCLLGGLWGTGGGLTSYSSNIAIIGLTKVASRSVTAAAAVLIVVSACVGKIGGLFATVPDPIIGGLTYVIFGMITAVGVSQLALADMKSTRNLFIFGFAVFCGLSLPHWIATNPIDVGNETASQVLTILCGTNMLVAGVISFILDSTIPGTLKERGIILKTETTDTTDAKDVSTYDIPLIQPLLDKVTFFKYFPFCPAFNKRKGDRIGSLKKVKTNGERQFNELEDMAERNGHPRTISGGIENEGFSSD